MVAVTIGSGVTWIGREAFALCKELTDVYCLAKHVPSTSSDIFKESDVEFATLHVPATAIDEYKTTEPWKSFMNIVVYDPSGIQGIKLDKDANIPVYDLNGRRLTEPVRGINIVGSKKVVVK